MDIENLTRSNTFCIYPWIHLHATPQGNINYCCVSMNSPIQKDSQQSFNLAQDSFNEAWNSTYMKELREKMLKGEKIPGCSTCYKQEEFGQLSHRQNYNKEWFEKTDISPLQNRIENSIANNFNVQEPPIHLDLRLGSLCNLRCRMCSPQNSTLIEKEWSELDQEKQGAYSEFWSEFNGELVKSGKWYEEPPLWEELEKLAPTLRKVYIAGGEPLLSSGNKKFLQTCIEKGVASRIELFVNTNLMYFNQEWVDIISHFKDVGINASLDGFGKVNEYIRHPSDWETIHKNLKTLCSVEKKDLAIGISLVAQAYNILDLHRLFEYGEEILDHEKRELHFDILHSYRPTFLDYAHLPQNIKWVAADRLDFFRKNSKLYSSKYHRADSLRNGLDSLIERLKSSSHLEDVHLTNRFIQYTNTLDKKRMQDFKEQLPELAESLKFADFDLNPEI